MYIGEKLVRENLISVSQLHGALQSQVALGGRLGSNLLRMGALHPDTFALSLSEFLHVAPARTRDFKAISTETMRLTPKELVLRWRALPIRPLGKSELMVAFVEPLNERAIREFMRVTRRLIRPAVASELIILDHIGRLFGTNLELQTRDAIKQEELPSCPIVELPESDSVRVDADPLPGVEPAEEPRLLTPKGDLLHSTLQNRRRRVAQVEQPVERPKHVGPRRAAVQVVAGAPVQEEPAQQRPRRRNPLASAFLPAAQSGLPPVKPWLVRPPMPRRSSSTPSKIVSLEPPMEVAPRVVVGRPLEMAMPELPTPELPEPEILIEEPVEADVDAKKDSATQDGNED